MEKGFGDAAKKVGKVGLGVGKVGARIAGAPLEALEGVGGRGESGKSIIGNIARIGESAAEQHRRSTSGAASYGSGQKPQAVETLMEKQEPEWTTPQTETPLHKFLEHTNKREG
jgi:hypothetical protein